MTVTDAPQQNYTTEQTTELIALYTKLGTSGLEQIATMLGKPVRSVRSKLVKEGVYKPLPKISSKRTGPSKKELLNDLEKVVGFDTTGLTGSTKESLQRLLDFLNIEE